MSGLLLPVTAAAFWLGLLVWPIAGRAIATPWGWIAPGLAALVGALALAPGRTVEGHPLREAGLIDPPEPPSLTAMGGWRLGRGRGPPGLLLPIAATGVFLLGAGWQGLHEQRVQGSVLARLVPSRIEVEGTLRTDPSNGGFGWSAIVDASIVRWAGGAAATHESVWVQANGDSPEAVRGDRVELSGEAVRPEEGGFAEFLRRRGMVAELRVDRFARVGPSANPFVRAAQRFRAFVGRSIAGLFPRREAGLLMGLALGDDSRLDPGLARDFRATGLGHLLVVSGENVAMVLGPVLVLALLLRLSRLPRLLLGAGTVAFFVVLTGAEPSVMRAGVMAVLTIFGVFLGRPRSAGSILSGAVLVLTIWDPTLVWSVGFQLSVAATAGMVALASPLAGRLRFLPRPVALAAGTTLAAQAGVSPILLFHFHEVPAITLFANLLAFPAVSPALLLGLLAAGIGLAVEPLGHVLAALALVPMRYLELVADRLARAPVPWVTSGGGLVPLVGGITVVGLAAWWLRSGRPLPRRVLVVGCALLPVFVWSTALSAGPPSGLVVRFFNVGQGDAALVSSPGGATVLVDAGPDPEVVATRLSALGVRRLDAIVATHPHADHVEGLPAVMARFPVGLVLDPGCDEPSPAYDDFLRAVGDERLPVRHPRAGDTLFVGDLRLDVLAPVACASGTDSDPNNDSLVIRLTYREDVVLFPGDAEEPEQQVLLNGHAPLVAEVLKVPHHGVATSLTGFFDAVQPEVAVVSVGPNDYGHPVPEVLDEIRATGAEVLRTDRLGDITVRFGPEGLLVQSAGT